MGTDLSTIVHVDESGQPLRPYKDELSAHPYFISLQDIDFGLHFSGNNHIHPRLNTCSPTTSGDQCPLVITLLLLTYVPELTTWLPRLALGK